MPKPDYDFRASVIIACPGPSEGEIRTGPAGKRRSRDGAKLAHVLADARYWYERFSNPPSPTHSVALLESPSRSEALTAMAEAGEFLRRFKDRPQWNGGQLDFVFAGHGTGRGEIVLSDANLSPEEIAGTVASSTTWAGGGQRLRLGLVLDCCFSGRTLVELLLHPSYRDRYLVIDGFAAALHDEVAWELDSLGHGALTYTMRHPGNAHVGTDRLARAVEGNDQEYLRLALQGFVPNPVTYLTEGDQHSIDLINGHALDVKGCGSVSILGEATAELVLEAIAELKANPNVGSVIEV